MSERVLVTGGAGFIGSHIVDELVRRGYAVRVLDALEPQVHGIERRRPRYSNSEAEFVSGDVRDRDAAVAALDGCGVLIHQAASVGVGQSMYEILSYVSHNTLGAATLLDVIAKERHGVRKMLVASSMSVYGEGKYRCRSCALERPQHELFAPKLRRREQLEESDWEVHCPVCGAVGEPVPCDESKPLYPTSVYAITKRDHEELFLTVGRAFGIPTVALRYFNIYGERQSLSNPYTGVAAIFASQLLNGNSPIVFEDGRQSRDFTHVSDVALANALAVEASGADYEAVNVGTGRRTDLLELLRLLRERLDPDGRIPIRMTGRFREGDIRHCYADIAKARRLLGYKPSVPFAEGVNLLVAWARGQDARDESARALAELEAKRLIR